MFESSHAFLKLRGVWDTLEILGATPDFCMNFTLFTTSLEEHSNYQAFGRAKTLLAKEGIIRRFYTLDNENSIQLTEKGKKLYNKLKDVAAILEGK